LCGRYHVVLRDMYVSYSILSQEATGYGYDAVVAFTVGAKSSDKDIANKLAAHCQGKCVDDQRKEIS